MSRQVTDSLILIAKSLVRLNLCWVAAGPLHFERRKAVESSFRGPPALQSYSLKRESISLAVHIEIGFTLHSPQ